MVLLRLPQDAAYGFLLRWLPALAWAAAAALLLSVWASQSRKSAPAAAQVS
jgi:hypothetical protein